MLWDNTLQSLSFLCGFSLGTFMWLEDLPDSLQSILMPMLCTHAQTSELIQCIFSASLVAWGSVDQLCLTRIPFVILSMFNVPWWLECYMVTPCSVNLRLCLIKMQPMPRAAWVTLCLALAWSHCNLPHLWLDFTCCHQLAKSLQHVFISQSRQQIAVISVSLLFDVICGNFIKNTLSQPCASRGIIDFTIHLEDIGIK